MTGAQKLIKLFALLLACVIIVGIGGAVVATVAFVGMAIGVDDGGMREMGQVWIEEEKYAQEKIRNLRIDVGATQLIVKTFDEAEVVSVETNLDYIETGRESDTLRVKEKSHFGLNAPWHRGRVLVKLPKDYEFEKIEVEVGAGALEVVDLSGKEVCLELGAGKTEIRNLTAKDHVKINGGAGYFSLRDSVLHDLDLDLGAGRSEIVADITGDSKIDSGVGSLDLELQRPRDQYYFRIDKGLGGILLDGEKVDDGKYGDGENELVVDSGVGSVTIKTARK